MAFPSFPCQPWCHPPAMVQECQTVEGTRGLSLLTACFGGIRHVWAKVVLLLWEVALCCKQGELRIAAVPLTVVSGKWLYEADYLQWASERAWPSQEWVLPE